jgi:acyl-coenzyme A thioesterase PaaI-like protein
VVAGAGVTPFELIPHNCFACGALNAHGLRLLIHVEPKRAWTELALDERFEGWAGIAHGGILATILDEVMAWSLVAEDNWGLTARLSVDFKRPVPVGVPIRAEGAIVSARRRVVETTAAIRSLTTGEILATARGTYVAAAAARKRELQDRYGFRSTRDRRSGEGAPILDDTPVTGDKPRGAAVGAE